ncbi:MAG: hypothetical protein HW418_3942 [Anaerolineales bacterium]|jgi:hypothetical protein|nr:hypothetical protein [Anaerolineales bacterium]
MKAVTSSQATPNSLQRLGAITLLSWFAMLGFDFFLHAGALARLYLQPSPFLLPPLDAFRLVPVGYLSFLLLAVLLLWLMVRLDAVGWRAGLLFGLKLGGLTWGAFALGLLSISTASVPLLMGWFVGQTLELALAGAIAGNALAGAKLSQLSVKVLAFVMVAVIMTIALQSLGLAPAVRM